MGEGGVVGGEISCRAHAEVGSARSHLIDMCTRQYSEQSWLWCL